MRELMVVAKFTLKDMLRKKSFRISTIIILILIVIGFNVPNLINTFSNKNSSSDKVLVVDNESIYSGGLDALNKMNLGYTFQIASDNMTADQIKDKVDNGDVGAGINLLKNPDGTLAMDYIVKNTSVFSPDTSIFVKAFTELYANIQIQKSGLTPAQIAALNANIQFNVTQTSPKSTVGNPVVTMLMSILLFYAIYFCAYQVSLSITTEKTSRIIETLVTSTKPRTIVLGKTIRNRNSRLDTINASCNRCSNIC